jgi:hypothetical protein
MARSKYLPAEILAAAYPRRRSSNANSLQSQNSAGFQQIRATFFKGIICADVSEFESYMPSQAVGLSQVRSPTGNLRAQGRA